MKSGDVLFIVGIAALLLFSSNGGAAVFARSRRRVTPEERERVLSAIAKLGFPRDEAAQAIKLESGWNPSAMHPTVRAVGLVQMLPATLRAVGYNGSPEQFAQLSVDEQLPYYLRVFKASRWQVPGDTYLAIAAPAYVGAPDHAIVFRKGSKAWQQNPGLRSAGDGDITAGSIRWTLLKHMPAQFEP